MRSVVAMMLVACSACLCVAEEMGLFAGFAAPQMNGTPGVPIPFGWPATNQLPLNYTAMQQFSVQITLKWYQRDGGEWKLRDSTNHAFPTRTVDTNIFQSLLFELPHTLGTQQGQWAYRAVFHVPSVIANRPIPFIRGDDWSISILKTYPSAEQEPATTLSFFCIPTASEFIRRPVSFNWP